MPGATDASISLCVPRLSSKKDPNVPILASSLFPQTAESNHIVIRIDRFGFSANNVTYQALGEAPHFRYFDFHAAPKTATTSPETHGLIPVWGFGTVVWTSHPRIKVGERVYGYFAPVRYLLVPVSPSDVNKYAFYVPRPHLPPDRRPYNQITRCSTDPLYDPAPEAEDLIMLYRPLFWTSFWCEDWLACSSYRGGATYVIISSASSKTAFCLAYMIRKRFIEQQRETSSGSEASGSFSPPTAPIVLGLTSPRNVGFTKSLGLYDEVLEYDAFFRAPTGLHHRYIYVDVAGNEAFNAQLTKYFASDSSGQLLAHIILGFTNLSPSSSQVTSVSGMAQNDPLSPPITPSDTNTSTLLPKPEQFFMPEWFAARRTQLSVSQIADMQKLAWTTFMRDCRGWVKIERVHGGEKVKKAYEEVARDGLSPDRGLVWSLWDEVAGDETNLRTKSKL